MTTAETGKMIDVSSSDYVIRNMAENDLLCNIDAGKEYTGFKDLYKPSMLKENHISVYGTVNDITSNKDLDKHHLLEYMKDLLKEESSPVVMTSGTFISMNPDLQSKVVKNLKVLSERGAPVTLYVGNGVQVSDLFTGSNVKVKVYEREKHHIIHFIKSKFSFNFVLPHTEDLEIRVDLNSKTFEKENRERILLYFDDLIKEFDKQI